MSDCQTLEMTKYYTLLSRGRQRWRSKLDYELNELWSVGVGDVMDV